MVDNRKFKQEFHSLMLEVLKKQHEIRENIDKWFPGIDNHWAKEKFEYVCSAFDCAMESHLNSLRHIEDVIRRLEQIEYEYSKNLLIKLDGVPLEVVK